ncbi:MAG TPA: helix-hairpin-helix domain-containing protein [Vicinamibacterales bacterium]|nr:helix-hairpin-helix domain-containing protein [Acidobacteriota bacterium]HOC19491.1 helix-hairpin-helix domain-containing protein [Vicinamibacterales bacterium]
MSRPHRLAALMLAALLLVPAVSLAQAPGQAAPPAASKTAPAATPVNLNTATVEQLDGLPGIGRAMATRILEYRQKAGGFKKVEELMNVRGIGEKNFLKLKPLVTVGPVKTSGQQ